MRIVVTGGAGFIGSHVVDACIRGGHRVAVIDNLSTGSRNNLNPRARFYKADIRNGRAVERIIQKERPHVLNHHAAKISVVESVKNPAETFEVNVTGTANLARAFGMHGPASAKASAGRRGNNGKFIFASTGGALYGEPKKVPANEETPILPLSPYGLSKFLAEEAVKFYARQYKFPYTVLRYANVYGPRQNPRGEGGVVAIFADLMRRGTRPVIYGDGSKWRDYVYIGDIARANTLALRKGANETMNIATGAATSDRKVFDTIARELRFKKNPVYKSFRKGEVYRITLDARRARRVLGWRPTVRFGEGVSKTIQKRKSPNA